MSAMAILPGATLGVLGGGQLGRMFALEAIRMGYTVWVLDADKASPAGLIAHRHLVADYTDTQALAELAAGCDAVTTEFENVPASVVEQLDASTRVAPGAHALNIAQDRRREKTLFAQAGVECARWAAIETAADVDSAWEYVSAPGIVKTAQFGYDGKGQVHCDSPAALASAFEALGGLACVFEHRVDLESEISVVVARATDGQAVCLPVGENCHRNGILHSTVLPASVNPSVQSRARETALAIASSLDYCGVLAVEFFVTTDGSLLANEIAPRPHNSGHYSQLGCDLNQFELQVRTLCGLPLVQPALRQPTAMLNLLGDLWLEVEPDWPQLLALPGVEIHLYGKKEARAGRKMGHINVTAATEDARDTLAATVCNHLRLPT